MRFILSVFFTATSFLASAQHVDFAQSIIDTLASPYFHGRGYVQNGADKAAEFIHHFMEEERVEALPNMFSYYHTFKFPVNTFPGRMEISSEKGDLEPGMDYIISPGCPSTYLQEQVVNKIGFKELSNRKSYKQLKKKDWTKQLIWLDTIAHNKKTQKRLQKVMAAYPRKTQFESSTNLTWSVSVKQNESCKVIVTPDQDLANKMVSINIEAKLLHYVGKNVVGMIKGSDVPDSFVLVTGHYDHLGRMGADTYMPGANDNASGIAMIFDLIKHFKANPPRYSVVFIAFGGEEAGLIGSYYFVNELDQYLDRNKIRFVANMDLMGSGQEGVTAVNGAVFKEEFNLLKSINDRHEYLPLVKMRGNAANSDHYFFSEAGIPAFFFYLMGPYSYYHDVEDSPKNLRLEKEAYDSSFKLIRDFIQALMFQN